MKQYEIRANDGQTFLALRYNLIDAMRTAGEFQNRWEGITVRRVNYVPMDDAPVEDIIRFYDWILAHPPYKNGSSD